MSVDVLMVALMGLVKKTTDCCVFRLLGMLAAQSHCVRGKGKKEEKQAKAIIWEGIVPVIENKKLFNL